MSRLFKPTIFTAALCALCMTSNVVHADHFEDLDSNNDGKLTRGEFDKGEIAFRAADTSGDGSISRAEFEKMAKEAAAEDPKVTEVKKQLIQLSGSLRSHLLRHDEYPSTLQGLVEKGLLKAIPSDPWGREFQYKLVDKKGGGEPARTVRINRDGKVVNGGDGKTKVTPKTFELLSAGIDGQYGNADDILKTEDGLRLSLTPGQREAILLEAGDAYKLAQRSYAWEQAYRVWLAVAEHEYSKGETVKELSTLTLPTETFPSGKAVDLLGRPLDLRSVRGLRAVSAALSKGDKEELTYTEAEFVGVLSARLATVNNGGDYRLGNAHRVVQSFWQSKGRLPLTMKEIEAFSSDRYFNRSNYGHSLVYVSFNDEKGYAIFDLGRDNQPGGLEENMDSVSYGPSDVTASGQSASQMWNNSTEQRKRYEGIQKAIQDALKRKEEEEAKKAAEAEKTAGAKETGDKAPEKEEKPSDVPIVPEEKPITPDESQSGGLAASFSVAVVAQPGAFVFGAPNLLAALEWLAAQVPPQPAQPAQPIPPAQPAAAPGEPAAAQPAPAQPGAAPEAGVPAEPAADEAGGKVLKTPADMIPLKVFDEIEAREVGLVSDDNWRWSSLNYQLRNVVDQTSSFLQAGDRKVLPWGNIEMPRNKDFLAALGEDFRGGGDEYFTKQFGKQVWCLARFEKGEFNSVKRAIGLVLPAKGRNDVIVIYRREGGESTGPYFADPKEQPAGWWAEMAACDAEPGVVASDAAAPVGKPAAPVEKEAEGEKSDAEKSDDSKPVPVPAK